MFLKKRIAVVFGAIGYVAMVLAALYLSKDRIFGAYAFCSISVLCTYVFLIYTQSKLSVLGAISTHIIAIVALYYSGSILWLSIPYMALPFMALMLRGLWLEQLGHTLKPWLEPLLFFIALALYGYEVVTNHQLSPDAKIFPLVYFIANGFMIGDVFLDAIKIKKRVKQGYGIGAGEPAPAFTLLNEKNEKVSLADFTSKHHVLLIFVRGEWCPMCHIMLRTYMKESALFQQKNVFLVVIGPDPTGVNRKMAEELKLDFHILSDPNLDVTHSYRLKIKAEHLLHTGNYNNEKEIPLPASFLIDKKGTIRYCSNPDKIGEVIKLTDIFPILQVIDGASAK